MRNVVGIDVGGTKILAGLVAPDGTARQTVKIPTPLDSSERVIDAIASLVDELRDDRTVGVGLSVLTLVTSVSDELGFAARVPIEGIRLRPILEERCGLPVRVENDGNAAALAEHAFGAGRGVDDMVMFVVGTYIGGGLVLNGRLYRGAHGVAGELGQVTIEMDVAEARTPRLGRLETMAAGLIMDARTQQLAEEHPDSDIGRAVARGEAADARLLLRLAERGPGMARQALDEIGFRFAVGVCAVVDVLNPEIVVLGGGVFSAGSRLLETVRRVVKEQVLPPARDVRIEVAQLGSMAGMLGAGIAGFEAATLATPVGHTPDREDA